MVADLDVGELIGIVPVHCVHDFSCRVALLISVDKLVLGRVHLLVLIEVGPTNLDAAAINRDLLSACNTLLLL